MTVLFSNCYAIKPISTNLGSNLWPKGLYELKTKRNKTAKLVERWNRFIKYFANFITMSFFSNLHTFRSVFLDIMAITLI